MIKKPFSEVACDVGILRFHPSGLVALDRAGRTTSVVVNDLSEGQYVEIWGSSSWCAAIGLESTSALIGHSRRGGARLSRVGPLGRLDFEGRYDPGGMHRVEFHDIAGSRLMVEYELGVALISESEGLVWDRVHDQIGARLESFTDKVVTFTYEGGAFGFRMSDGCPMLVDPP